MKAKTKAKFNVFAMLGWLLWKLLALFGSRYAKNKLDERRTRQARASAGPLQRGLRGLTSTSRRR